MAHTKMNLAEFSGLTDELDNLIKLCCEDDLFSPEQANKYISSTMGFLPFSESNSYKDMLRQLKDISSTIKHDFPVNNSLKITDIDESTQIYLDDLTARFNKLREEKKQLLEQKEKIENGITVFSHYIDLDIRLETISESQFVLTRFGRMSQESYTKYKNSQHIKANPFLMFIPSFQDDNDCWGIYMTPKSKATVVDRIFAGLYFERFDVPGAAGTPMDVLEQLKESINIIEEQIDKLHEKTEKIWDDNKEKCSVIYSSLIMLDKAYELKKYAIIKNNYFFFVGKIPKRHSKHFAEKFKELNEVSVEILKT